ncbi:MAG: HEAT repeat domain-containing protein [Candidatus Bathyarchaeota archaeon]|nr:HEAT repeat domain-containing protein [Candidatus Bathyarchaeota archaeon]
MPFCIKCSQEIPVGASFCPNCGATVSPKVTVSRSIQEKFEKRVNELFFHTNWKIRAYAATDLGKIGGAPALREKAVRALAQALINDIDYNIRLNAAESLGKIGDPRAVEPLAKATEDSSSAVRDIATQALGKIGKPAVEALIKALKSNDDGVRMYAAMELGKIKDPRAVKPLIEAMRIKTRLGGAEGSAAQALTEIGEPAVESLIAKLKDSDEKVRRLAAISLGDIGDIRAVDPLIDALKDSSEKVQGDAARALKKIGSEKAEKAVRDYRKQLPWYKRF